MKGILGKITKLLIIVSTFALISCSYNKSMGQEESNYANNNGDEEVESEEVNFEVTSEEDDAAKEDSSNIEGLEEKKISVQVGDKSFTAILYDNDSVNSIIDMLPLTLKMSDLNKNEKFYNFDKSFPTDTQRVEKINNGDIMLYGSTYLVLFYESFSTMYSYTPLGYIEDPTGLKEVVGNGNVTITFSIE